MDYSIYIATTVKKDWYTDSYVIEYGVIAEIGDELHNISSGTETFGPLWSVDQVERLVSLMSDRLRGLDWSEQVARLTSDAQFPARGVTPKCL